MRRKMRLLSVALPVALAGRSLLSLPPSVSAQRVRQRIIIVQPFDPFFPGAYPYYPYAVYSMLPNYGQVKIEPVGKMLPCTLTVVLPRRPTRTRNSRSGRDGTTFRACE